MGVCCTNEIRGKKLDAKEFDMYHDDQASQGTAKSSINNLSISEQDIIFDGEIRRLCSPNAQVNVSTINNQQMYNDKGPYKFTRELGNEDICLILRGLQILSNGDQYYGFW